MRKPNALQYVEELPLEQDEPDHQHSQDQTTTIVTKTEDARLHVYALWWWSPLQTPKIHGE